MKYTPHTMPSYVINFFFVLGLVSAFAFRVLIVFKHLKPEFVRPVWYFGIIGYIFFFLYRYFIAQKRRRVIDENNLIAKLSKSEELSANDREVTIYLLSSLTKSLENINYLFIVALSVTAVLFDIILTVYGK